MGGSPELFELNIDRPSAQLAKCLSTLCPIVLHCGDVVRREWFDGERRLLNHFWFFIGSGKGTMKINGVEQEITANDLIWIPPDTLFEMRGTSPMMHCAYAHVDLLYSPSRSRLFHIPDGHSELGALRQWQEPPLGYEDIDSLCGLVKLKAPMHFKMLFQTLCHVYKTTPAATLKMAGIILEMLDEILSATAGGKPSDAKLEAAESHIRNHLNENLDVSALARQLGISPAHFRRIFTSVHGKGPVTFHRELRMQAACDMMLHEGYNVSETADFLGFSSIHSFSRTFSKTMNFPPKKYCKRNS